MASYNLNFKERVITVVKSIVFMFITAIVYLILERIFGGFLETYSNIFAGFTTIISIASVIYCFFSNFFCKTWRACR